MSVRLHNILFYFNDHITFNFVRITKYSLIHASGRNTQQPPPNKTLGFCLRRKKKMNLYFSHTHEEDLF